MPDTKCLIPKKDNDVKRTWLEGFIKCCNDASPKKFSPGFQKMAEGEFNNLKKIDGKLSFYKSIEVLHKSVLQYLFFWSIDARQKEEGIPANLVYEIGDSHGLEDNVLNEARRKSLNMPIAVILSTHPMLGDHRLKLDLEQVSVARFLSLVTRFRQLFSKDQTKIQDFDFERSHKPSSKENHFSKFGFILLNTIHKECGPDQSVDEWFDVVQRRFKSPGEGVEPESGSTNHDDRWLDDQGYYSRNGLKRLMADYGVFYRLATLYARKEGRIDV